MVHNDHSEEPTAPYHGGVEETLKAVECLDHFMRTDFPGQWMCASVSILTVHYLALTLEVNCAPVSLLFEPTAQLFPGTSSGSESIVKPETTMWAFPPQS